jgi:arylsulfatase A-like enzyme
MKHPELFNYTIDVFHASGMSWLEEVAKKSEPFFLYLSYTVPHAGGWGDAPSTPEQGAPVPTDLQYGKKPWPDVEKDHAAVITYLDQKVGDLLSRLKGLGVDKDTLIFFASDNGAHLEGGHSHLFFNSTGGLPGHKRSMYEGGVRSPTMVRWPGVIKPGRSSDFPWAFWDVMPTLAELAGARVEADIDGISIVPELYGKSQPEHAYIFFTWIGDGGRFEYEMPPKKGYPGYTVRVGDLKGMVPHCKDTLTLQPSMDDDMRLFDLKKDPLETTDLAEINRTVVTRLKRFVMSKNLTCMCYQCGFGLEASLLV